MLFLIIFNNIIGLGDMTKNVITMNMFISVYIDHCRDKLQIIISFKLKG